MISLVYFTSLILLKSYYTRTKFIQYILSACRYPLSLRKKKSIYQRNKHWLTLYLLWYQFLASQWVWWSGWTPKLTLVIFRRFFFFFLELQTIYFRTQLNSVKCQLKSNLVGNVCNLDPILPRNYLNKLIEFATSSSYNKRKRLNLNHK